MGRGNWYRYDAKTAVEHCQKLDVRKLKLKTGNSFNVPYSTGSDRGRNLTISVTWTRSYFGGKRAWWLCPGCGKRVAILYLRRNSFRCRICHDLAYRSSQESRFDRHLRKKFKLCDKLGIGPIDTLWFKPKHMHQTTFDRLHRQHQKATGVTVQDLFKVLEILKDLDSTRKCNS